MGERPLPPGHIFFVSADTEKECLTKQLAGLPPGKKAVVARIKAGDPIFVYNTTSRLFHGVFEAVGDGGYKLDPDAFGGGYPSQVRFAVAFKCPDQPLAAVRHVLPMTGDKKGHFSPELEPAAALKLRNIFERAAGKPLTTHRAAAPARTQAPGGPAPGTPPAAAPVSHGSQQAQQAQQAAQQAQQARAQTQQTQQAQQAQQTRAQAPAGAHAASPAQPPSQASGPGAASAPPSSQAVSMAVLMPWLVDDDGSHSNGAPHTAAAPQVAAHHGAGAGAAMKECVICMEVCQVSDMMALIPCGHRCICLLCSQVNILPGTDCPKCRAQTMFAIRIWDD